MKYTIFLVAILISGCSSFPLLQNNEMKIDQSIEEQISKSDIKVIQLLENGKINEAFELLSNKYKAALADPKKEDSFVMEFMYAQTTTKNLDSVIDDFVSLYANQSLPYTFRGCYLFGKSLRTRGEKWIHETSKIQINNMTSLQGDAISDFDRATNISPEIYYPYMKLALIYGMRSDELDLANKYYEIALSKNSKSFWIWSALLDRSTPRWGGSYEKMEEIIRKMEISTSMNSFLIPLKGSILRDKGSLEENRRNYAQAKKYYNEALSYGDLHGVLVGLGYIHIQEGNYKVGCELIDKAVDLRPYDHRTNANLVNCRSRGY